MEADWFFVAANPVELSLKKKMYPSFVQEENSLLEDVEKLGNVSLANKTRTVLKFTRQLNSAQALVDEDLKCLKLGTLPSKPVSVKTRTLASQELTVDYGLKIRIANKQKEIEKCKSRISQSIVDLSIRFPAELYGRFWEHYCKVLRGNSSVAGATQPMVSVPRTPTTTASTSDNAPILIEIGRLKDPALLDAVRWVGMLAPWLLNKGLILEFDCIDDYDKKDLVAQDGNPKMNEDERQLMKCLALIYLKIPANKFLQLCAHYHIAVVNCVDDIESLEVVDDTNRQISSRDHLPKHHQPGLPFKGGAGDATRSAPLFTRLSDTRAASNEGVGTPDFGRKREDGFKEKQLDNIVVWDHGKVNDLPVSFSGNIRAGHERGRSGPDNLQLLYPQARASVTSSSATPLFTRLSDTRNSSNHSVEHLRNVKNTEEDYFFQKPSNSFHVNRPASAIHSGTTQLKTGTSTWNFQSKLKIGIDVDYKSPRLIENNDSPILEQLHKLENVSKEIEKQKRGGNDEDELLKLTLMHGKVGEPTTNTQSSRSFHEHKSQLLHDVLTSERRFNSTGERRFNSPSERLPNSTSERRPNSTSERRPNSTSERRPNSTSERRPNSTSERRPNSTSERRPNSTSERLPNSTSERRPNSTSERRPNSTSERRPNSTSERRPNSTSERRPNSTSERRSNSTNALQHGNLPDAGCVPNSQPWNKPEALKLPLGPVPTSSIMVPKSMSGEVYPDEKTLLLNAINNANSMLATAQALNLSTGCLDNPNLPIWNKFEVIEQPEQTNLMPSSLQNNTVAVSTSNSKLSPLVNPVDPKRNPKNRNNSVSRHAPLRGKSVGSDFSSPKKTFPERSTSAQYYDSEHPLSSKQDKLRPSDSMRPNQGSDKYSNSWSLERNNSESRRAPLKRQSVEGRSDFSSPKKTFPESSTSSRYYDSEHPLPSKQDKLQPSDSMQPNQGSNNYSDSQSLERRIVSGLKTELSMIQQISDLNTKLGMITNSQLPLHPSGRTDDRPGSMQPSERDNRSDFVQLEYDSEYHRRRRADDIDHRPLEPRSSGSVRRESRIDDYSSNVRPEHRTEDYLDRERDKHRSRSSSRRRDDLLDREHSEHSLRPERRFDDYPDTLLPERRTEDYSGHQRSKRRHRSGSLQSEHRVDGYAASMHFDQSGEYLAERDKSRNRSSSRRRDDRLDRDHSLRRDDRLDRDHSLRRDDRLDRDHSLRRDDSLDRDHSLRHDDRLDRDHSLRRDDRLDRVHSLRRDDRLDRDHSLRRDDRLDRDHSLRRLDRDHSLRRERRFDDYPDTLHPERRTEDPSDHQRSKRRRLSGSQSEHRIDGYTASTHFDRSDEYLD